MYVCVLVTVSLQTSIVYLVLASGCYSCFYVLLLGLASPLWEVSFLCHVSALINTLIW